MGIGNEDLTEEKFLEEKEEMGVKSGPKELAWEDEV